jgi:ribosomal protein S18 acetylase RimI-like enzyme
VTAPYDTTRRVLAEAIRHPPERLHARPVEPADLDALTALVRAGDIAGCGHTSTNREEISATLSTSGCNWAHGAAGLWRGDEIVGALIIDDGLAARRGWLMDVYCRPGDPHAHGIGGALLDAALREGRARFDASFPDPEEPMQSAKAGAYANDGALRSELEERGFAEVRRFWRMKVDHVTMADVLAPAPLPRRARAGGQRGAAAMPKGYLLRQFRDVEEDWRGLHAANSASFMDHFDFTPVGFEEWRERHHGEIEDPTMWIVVESGGEIVGHATGSHRYASEDYGYVSSLGVNPEHRGRGLGRALLRARLADDVSRGFIGTVLHVDATNPTGATDLYESVGMRVDSEFVGFHRPLYG